MADRPKLDPEAMERALELFIEAIDAGPDDPGSREEAKRITMECLSIAITAYLSAIEARRG